MIENWRTTTDITLMVENIDGSNVVYIASPEKKQYEVAVSRLSKNIYKTTTIENKDLEVKIGDKNGDFAIYLKTDKIPELGWAEIMNFYKPSIWKILEQCKTKNGVLDDKFQVSFTDSDLKIITIVNSGMKEYTEYQSEMIRKLSCEIGKKTKTLKPGHRYDLLKETRYYLCPIIYRKSCLRNSGFLIDSEASGNKAYIYTNAIKPGNTTIEDVLMNSKFGIGPYDLKVALSDSSSWIDSGEKLKNDFSGDIKDYWEPIIDNAVKAYTEKLDNSEYYTCSDHFRDIFEVLACQTPSLDISYKIDEPLKSKISKIVSDKLEYDFLRAWKLRNKDKNLELDDSRKLEDNTNALIGIFYRTIVDENIEKLNYYSGLFSAIGIQLTTMATNQILSFSESDLTRSFESFLKYKFFWKNKIFLYSKPILNFSINRIKDSSEEVKNLFIGFELASTICELFNYSNANYGDGVSEYKVKVDKSTKEQVVFCQITLQDIIKFKKGVSKLSENLKSEIKDNKFSTIIINCKKSDII